MHSNSGRAANAEPARPLRPKLALMRSLAGGAVIALAACAATIASVGRAATAPVLDGCGWQTLASKSPSAKADALFQQGVAQADAFNEVEAVRMFKAALGADSGQCAGAGHASAC